MTATRTMRQATTFEYLRGRGKLALAVALGFALLALAGVLAARFSDGGAAGPTSFRGMILTPPQAVPALTLERSDGTAWNSGETDGRISLFFFGYTNCPDVCPLTLSRANQIHQQLGEDAGKVDVYFVTVDPQRDTPERLGLYVSQFNPAFVGLTGSTGQLEAARNAFGVVAVQQEAASGAGYTVDHTASSFVIDQSGSIRVIFPHDAPAGDVAADIRNLLAEAGS